VAEFILFNKDFMSVDKKKILIVDDEADLVGILEVQLQSMGYSTITAEDGEVGIEMVKLETPDIILLDVMMPKLDGYQVCKLLKNDQTYAHIPIIMLTARAQAQDIQKGKDAGANDYMTKPFDNKILMEKIQKLLS